MYAYIYIYMYVSVCVDDRVEEVFEEQVTLTLQGASRLSPSLFPINCVPVYEGKVITILFHCHHIPNNAGRSLGKYVAMATARWRSLHLLVFSLQTSFNPIFICKDVVIIIPTQDHV